MADTSTADEQKNEVTTVRESLLEARRRILDQYQRDVREGQESSEEASQDLVDRAASSYNREFLFTLSGSHRESLLAIEEALERLDDGTYGICVNCGKPIGAPRLEAMPWAHHCIACQELEEQGLLEEEE